MNVTTDGCFDIVNTILKTTEMLQNISKAEMQLQQDLLKLNVTSHVEGLGEQVDISV